MNSLKTVSVIMITAVFTNMFLAVFAGAGLTVYNFLFGVIVIAVFTPGIFSKAKLTDAVKGSRILRYVLNIR